MGSSDEDKANKGNNKSGYSKEKLVSQMNNEFVINGSSLKLQYVSIELQIRSQMKIDKEMGEWNR